ncbi:glycoside hydrolase family 3 C-terminal domain-containing protein [Mycolicibacterium litorale]|uniref:Exo-alpha-(1->6)-L-arabinopyranosidase n=1 Tax=Mycolicibacterium litorale TaxID=758802 RepID=A0AAD1IKZ5_9MYCO|nr:glycoside hydrolase family 3 C-terminal domain-containing protein [Mycolicibacterium litorale]MCV7415914.1 glycoside hydrolase family 3 C-terminal domain-containing protein [Mycolicibacterium litorale]TDY09166.1 beta-glucosidase [Mycolicibacterium litorale]BBY17104.1 glycosyl hydrolase [Mycolicibacterium litorale]
MPDDPVDVTSVTLEAKAALGSGQSFWRTKAVGGLPAVVLTDGPHGVRAQADAADNFGVAGSAPATCFPPAAGLAQSWDRGLVERVGAALADEARSLGVNVLLGPGVNIKRDPRCGRNFEYLSEDPILSGMLGASWVNGLQGGGVGASVKHLAANNAESDRMRSDSRVEPRALREIYLKSFERVVTESQPWTVMCSYNKINGVYASENRWLLTDVLRHQWGFTGAVVSDWGAVNDRVAAMAAGLDLAMPGGDPSLDDEVIAAVAAGDLDEATVDETAGRVIGLLRRAADNSGPVEAVDLDAHHALAREAASRSVALLKNAGGVLPLAPDRRLAVIGRFATEPHYQGGGSSRVNAARVDIPLDEIRSRTAADVTCTAGFGAEGDPAHARADAVAAARAADVAVVFLGLSDLDESEGYDRDDIDLPEEQLHLLAAVAEVQPHTVAVLSHGGVVRLDDVDRRAAAVLDGGLLGQGGGAAVADVLFGVVNPSGRLAETVPVRLEDVPSFLNFPGEHSHVLYGEGIHVGYRWYDARAFEVTYPFGHGLSYTTFGYGSVEARTEDGAIRVALPVSNTGPRDGREVVQVYVSKAASDVQRPPQELKGFQVVDLPRGSTSMVVIRIALEDLAYWDDRVDDWVLEGGDYTIRVGSSSRDIRCTTDVRLEGDGPRIALSENSTIAEVLAHPVAGPLFTAMARQAMPAMPDALSSDGELVKMVGSIPLHRIRRFAGGIGQTAIDRLLQQANQPLDGQQ